MTRVVERSVQHILVRFTGLGLFRLLGQRIDKVGVNLWPGNNPRSSGAILTSVEISRHCDCLHRKCDIRIVENDDRRFTAKFEMHALQALSRSFGDLHARAYRARHRHHPRRVVRNHGPTRVPIAADHIEHPRGQHFAGDLGEQCRRSRSRIARLEHAGVTRRNRRNELPHTHHQRIIPRCNLGTDTNRLAANIRREVRYIFTGTLALQHAGSTSEESNLIHSRWDFFGVRNCPWFAGVFDLGFDQFLHMGFHRIGNVVDRLLAYRWRGVLPRLKRLGSRLHGVVNVGGARQCGLAILLSRHRVDNRSRSPVTSRYFLAVDVVQERFHSPTLTPSTHLIATSAVPRSSWVSNVYVAHNGPQVVLDKET